MGSPYNKMEIASLNSASKGFTGEYVANLKKNFFLFFIDLFKGVVYVQDMLNFLILVKKLEITI